MEEKLLGKIRPIVSDLLGEEVKVELEHPGQDEHGDYSTNVAMAVFGKTKNGKRETNWTSPMELAEEIKVRLEGREGFGELVEKIEVAPPGFINFWLSKQVLVGELEEAVQSDYGRHDWGRGRKVVVDYSGPNIAKPFGIGHLRSTIVGQAVCNLYSYLGWKTIGDNHIGDWGTQFGRLLYQITSKGLDPKQLTIDELEKLYVEFNTEAQENLELNEEARRWFKKLEDGDSEARAIWEVLREISFREYERIYDLLDVHIENAYGESSYESMLGEVIGECLEKKVAREDQGALIIEYPDGMTPGILRKSDGASTYLTRDLATIKFRLEKWNPDLVIYEVGAEQSLHFQQVFAAAELLGWGSKGQFYHLKHGLYLSPSGKKFSTRRGDTVHLEEVLEEAVERAGKLAASGPATGSSPEKTEQAGPRFSGGSPTRVTRAPDLGLARVVGVGAVKYFDLSHHPASDIVFDWEKIMALEGNSAPYIQYTSARCRSVLQQARISNLQFPIYNKFDDYQFNNEEMVLLRTFYKFPEVLRQAAENFSPNLLANFLFDLAQKYNAFYNRHRILPVEAERYNRHRILGGTLDNRRQTLEKDLTSDAPVPNVFRLVLTQGVGSILKTGLSLLGIEAPEKM
ncbi:MAG: arginine--tRNA ligase [Candidatus Blackburnbacteria bacterium RIFCSPLOWO2_02_FULL_44_9]|nr:MAG: arginine--tRNA ligase [Candidatus Blackburnbacteria bacterium RIFCSPLOWO2_02_FULL_44_9]